MTHSDPNERNAAGQEPNTNANNEGTPEGPRVFPKRHPAGLWVLFTTEMWERFCYYGMRAFLVLYIYSAATSSHNPGFGWSQSDAYDFYGYFTGLVYLMPLLCGWIADKFIGQHRSLVFGGILIALGEFTLAATEFVRHGESLPVTLKTDPVALMTFFAGLALIIIGTGFFKPCVSVMVGQLYEDGDPRRDGGFTIFYMGINLGAFLSPLIAGTIAEKIGWEWGFFTAGIGMVFGLITYSLFRNKYMGHIGLPPKKTEDLGQLTDIQLERAKKAEYERTRPLTRVDLDRVFVLLAMTLFTIAFWVAFEQAGSSLNVFGKMSTDRVVSGPISESIPERIRTNILLENEFVDLLTESIVDAEKIEKKVQSLLSHEQEKTQQQFEPEAPLKRMMPFEKLSYFFSNKKAEQEEKKQSAEELVAELSPRADRINRYKKAETTETPSSEDGSVQADSPDTLAQKLLTLAYCEPDYFVKDPLKRKSSAGVFDLTPFALSDADQKELYSQLGRFPLVLAKIEDASVRAQRQLASGQKHIRTFPATWYQSVNSCCIIIFAPIFAFMWVYLGSRGLEPSTPVKFGIGLLLLSTSFMVMVPGAIEAKHGLAAPYWLVLSYMLATWGELCLSPVGLSMVTKLSPARFSSLLMGFWFVSSAIANWLSGFLAARFGTESEDGVSLNIWFGAEGGMADFFLLMTLIPATVGFIVLILSPKLKKKMHGAS